MQCYFQKCDNYKTKVEVDFKWTSILNQMKRPLFSRSLHWIWNLANFMQLVNQHKLQTSNKCPRESGTNQRQPEPFPQHHQHAASSSCSINIMIEENWPMPEIPTPLGRLWSAILESTITSAFQGIRNATEACFFPLYWRIPLVVVFWKFSFTVMSYSSSDQSSFSILLLWPIKFKKFSSLTKLIFDQSSFHFTLVNFLFRSG